MAFWWRSLATGEVWQKAVAAGPETPLDREGARVAGIGTFGAGIGATVGLQRGTPAVIVGQGLIAEGGEPGIAGGVGGTLDGACAGGGRGEGLVAPGALRRIEPIRQGAASGGAPAQRFGDPGVGLAGADPPAIIRRGRRGQGGEVFGRSGGPRIVPKRSLRWQRGTGEPGRRIDRRRWSFHAWGARFIAQSRTGRDVEVDRVLVGDGGSPGDIAPEVEGQGSQNQPVEEKGDHQNTRDPWPCEACGEGGRGHQKCFSIERRPG